MAVKKEPTTLNKILSDVALMAVETQNINGSFTAGHNGPYFDPETPVRNTAHFLFLLSKEYEKTNYISFKKAAYNAIDYLQGNLARPYNYTFYCRSTPGKDKCNGLIGQAWVIEALLIASQIFHRSDCYELAEKIFLMHPFDPKNGVWRRVEIDGTILSPDATFNHQLWFAAVGSMLHNTPVVKHNVMIFLDRVCSHVQLYPNGTIFHLSKMGSIVKQLKYGIKPVIREIFKSLTKKRYWEKLYEKSVGYHAFNLYAFAILHDTFTNLPFWQDQKFKQILSAPQDHNFLLILESSVFGYHYNLSGIEIAYAYETFGLGETKVTEWLNKQFEHSLEDRNHLFSQNASDRETAQARTYEIERIEGDYKILI